MAPSLARIAIVEGMVAPVSASITRPARVAGRAAAAARRNTPRRTADLSVNAIGVSARTQFTPFFAPPGRSGHRYTERMGFRLVVNYLPRGDQVNAIAELTRGVREGEQHQVLLGVTGSGKTFTMAKVIEAMGRPALVLAHNKTLSAQLYPA